MAGRPRKPEEKKKVKLTISLSKDLKAIAMATGDASEFFTEAAMLKIKKDQKPKKEIV